MSTRSLPTLAKSARFQRRPVNPVADAPRPASAAVAEARDWTGDDLPHLLPKPPEPAEPKRFGAVRLADMLAPEQNSFGVLRLMMALAVLVSHSVFLASGRNELEPLYAWTGYTLGQHGVQVFFILSGILVAQSLLRSQSVRDYALARGLRIFPALVVCVLATALVLGPSFSSWAVTDYLKDKGVALYIVKTVSLWSGSATLPGLFETAPGAAKGVVNSSLWTLKYEVMCYVLLAAVGAVALWTQAWRTVAGVALAGWLALILASPASLELGVPKTTFDVLRYFLVFFGTGVAAFVFARWIPVTGLLLVPFAALSWAAIGTRFAEPALALSLGYGAIWLASFTFGPMRAYSNENDYSYGVYIYSLPVTQVLLQAIPGLNLFSLITLTLAITLVLAFLSWELVERPALALKRRSAAKLVDAEAEVEATAPAVAPAVVPAFAAPAPLLDAARAKSEAAAAALAAKFEEARRRALAAAAPASRGDAASDAAEIPPPPPPASRLAFAVKARPVTNPPKPQIKVSAAQTPASQSDPEAAGWVSRPRPRPAPSHTPVVSS